MREWLMTELAYAAFSAAVVAGVLLIGGGP
jgi:hypothetical protein